MAGVPTIAIYDGVHANPARIQGFDLGGDGGMVLDSGAPAGVDTSLALGGNFGELFYEDVPNAVSALIHVGVPLNEAIRLRATGNGARDLEIGHDLTTATPDNIGGRMYTFGEIYMNQGVDDSNYANRVVDGKVAVGQTVTTIGTGAGDVNIGGANAQNVYVEEGWLYKVTVCIDQRATGAGNRLDYKLWDGSVGGTQLGGTNRTVVESLGANFDHQILLFGWRQATTKTISNMNLSAEKQVVGSGTVEVATNAAYFMFVEKCGDADKIGSL